MKRRKDNPARREAADWILASRHRPLTRRERRQLADWLRDSPANVREYLEAATIWNDMAHIDADRDIDVSVLSTSNNVVPFPEAAPVPQAKTFRHGQLAKWLAAAAGVVVLVAAVLYPNSDGDTAQRVSTALGEQRSVPLDDGSIIHLNTKSEVRIEVGERRRVVHLVAGEALFEVRRDRARPFAVRVGTAEIQVTGTRFNVRRRGGFEVVTVVAGAVEVGPFDPDGPTSPRPVTGNRSAMVEVEAGQQVRIDHSGRAGPPAAVRVEDVIVWTERRLVFNGDTLSAIADEFNRYNARQLRIVHPTIGGLRLSGVFAANDPDSLLEYLQTLDGYAIDIEHGDGTITLSRGR